MQQVVGIKFKATGKIYYFNPMQVALCKGDYAIVETARGVEYGEAVTDIKEVSEEELVAPLKPVIRKATPQDSKTYAENKEKAKDALCICEENIQKHQLDMKLIDAEYTFDKTKIIFYFTADGRIDFRELVKDLAAIFRIRIELRQIGVRDETKLYESLGPCGRPICCSQWLGDFNPVSIKMAKEQNLSLNPSKISGICGRLLCCLKYEYDMYRSEAKTLLPAGAKVLTEDGEGVVEKVNVLARTLQIRLKEGENIVREYNNEEVKLLGKVAELKRLRQIDYADLTKEEIRELERLEKEFGN